MTSASVAASLLVTFLVSLTFGLRAGLAAYLVSGLVPLLVAAPASYWQRKRLEQVRMAYRDLERVASIDWLTGCLNRRVFTARAGAATANGSALLIIDADAFKSVNDQFGHDRGDEALRSIAGVIRSVVANEGIVGRLGGEEFGVSLRNATAEAAVRLAEEIREAVQDIAFTPEGSAHGLSVSIGVAASDVPVSFAELFKAADRQLYVAKANGRNCVAVTAGGGIEAARKAA